MFFSEKKIPVFFLIIVILFLTTCSEGEKPSNLLVIQGNTMGTTYSVKIVKNNFLLLGNVSEKVKELTNGINDTLKDVNQKMSTFIRDSEISKFNNSKSEEWFDVSADTLYVVKNSLKISRISGGSFDITIGPVIELWGFGSELKPQKVPPLTNIQMAKKKTGYKNITTRDEPPALRKSFPQISCDLSAIAKGFGVDKVTAFLDGSGVFDYLVEIGGEIRVRGNNDKGIPWKLGILSPDKSGDIKKIISLNNLSMATSGDYFNYFEEGGKRYSHTIDPLTGYPITHKLVSVTVIHNECMKADALATAINVLGPDKGFELAVKEGLAAYFIIKSGKGFVEKMTPSFSTLIVEKK